MARIYITKNQWYKRRQRIVELKARWPFANEVLDFYATLLDVQEAAFERAQCDEPVPSTLATYVAERVLPSVLDLSLTCGPQAMVAALVECFHHLNPSEIVQRWLRHDDLLPFESYLARAAAGPVLEALGSAAGNAPDKPGNERRCPTCGGLPQLSFFAASTEDLTTAHRFLECSCCAATWTFPRMTCAGCGEIETSRLTIYSEIGTAQSELSGKIVKSPNVDSPTNANVMFPHIRVDGCQTCSRYLLAIDLERDGKAVPLVDELAAIPLALYAIERGMTKIAPNLMGF